MPLCGPDTNLQRVIDGRLCPSAELRGVELATANPSSKQTKNRIPKSSRVGAFLNDLVRHFVLGVTSIERGRFRLPSAQAEHEDGIERRAQSER